MKFPALVEVLSQIPGPFFAVRVKGELRIYVLPDSEKWRVIRALSINQSHALKMLERFERDRDAEKKYVEKQIKNEEAAILDAVSEVSKVQEKKGKRK